MDDSWMTEGNLLHAVSTLFYCLFSRLVFMLNMVINVELCLDTPFVFYSIDPLSFTFFTLFLLYVNHLHRGPLSSLLLLRVHFFNIFHSSSFRITSHASAGINTKTLSHFFFVL